MYLEHFGLNVSPFGLSHKLSFLYRSSAFEESMAHLIYGLDQREPVVLITGAIGTGKTMALQSFLTNLGPNYEFALVTNTRVNAVELLKLVLDDLGIMFPSGSDKSDLLILLKNFLVQTTRDGRKVLIVLDEAQNLSRDVLEEIRLLTNLGQGEGQPVQIILVGQPELETIVNQPELTQLRQRIRVHYKLDTLDRSEIKEYIDHRMRIAGCDYEAFSFGAVDNIFQYSGGVPRLVNTYCAEALLAAYVAGDRTITEEHVEVPGEDSSLEVDGAALTRPLTAKKPSEAPPASAPPVPSQAIPVHPTPTPPAPAQEAPEPYAVRRRRETGGGRRWSLAALLLVVLSGAIYFSGVWEIVAPSARSEHVSVDRQVAVTPEIDQEADQPGARPMEQESVESAVPETADETVSGSPATPEVVDARLEPTAELEAPERFEGPVFHIHVASFKVRSRASNTVATWEGHGYSAHFRREIIRGVEWYRILLGPFAGREDAVDAANQLVDQGLTRFYRVTGPEDPAGS